MKIDKVRLRQFILEELQTALDEGFALDEPETPEERATMDAAWASAKEAPPRPPAPEQASAIRKIAHTLLDTGLDPNDASVWEMVKDAVKRSDNSPGGGMFPRAEGLAEELGDKGSINIGASPHDSNISFDWSRDGLTMWMFVDSEPVATFSTQKEIQSFIDQLQGLLSGPMRTSP